MKFVDEFREPEVITRTSAEIRRLADPSRHYRIMEVCGGHTHAIYRLRLKDLLHRTSNSFTVRVAPSACCRWAGSMMAWPSHRIPRSSSPPSVT